MRKNRALKAAARKAARERKERRESMLILIGVDLLMIGAVVADFLFIRAGKRFHHQRRYHQQAMTNSPLPEPIPNTNRRISL